MDWLCITINTESPQEVCDKLYGMDIASVEIEDADEFEDFLENNKKYWDYVDESVVMPKIPKVKFYIEDDEKTDEILTEVRNISDKFSVSKIAEQDWANNWKKYYKPLHIGKNVVIKPFWEEYTANPEEKVITMDPGAAFGTGSHETTSMCIELLEKYISGGYTVLDIGCGSGILSVASCILGAKDVTAVDIDPLAVKTTLENAKLNSIPDGTITAIEGNLTDKVSEKFNIVVANIVADVIISLCPQIDKFLEKDGLFICSGIINERADEVKNAIIASGYDIKESMNKKEWNAFLAVRRM